jgi:hypothetical protein
LLFIFYQKDINMKLRTLIGISALLISSNTYAGLVGVWGNDASKWNGFLTGTGMTAVNVNANTSLETLETLEQVWLIRTDGNSNLIDYVSGGGTLVTEWSAAAWVANAGLINADLVSSGHLGSQAVTFNQKGLGLGLGNLTGNPHSNGGATEFFHVFNNVQDTTEVIATLDSGQIVGLHNPYASGQVVSMGWDWQDLYANTTVSEQFVRDIVSIPSFSTMSASQNVSDVSSQAPVSLALFGLTLVGMGRLRKQRSA